MPDAAAKPTGYAASLTAILLDRFAGTDNEKLLAQGLLVEMASKADAYSTPSFRPSSPFMLNVNDVVRMTCAGMGDVDGEGEKHFKPGDYALISSITSNTSAGLSITVTIAYGPGQFVNNSFDEDDEPPYRFPFELVTNRFEAALVRLALQSQLYYDENITVLANDDKSRPPTGDDFNELMLMVKVATQCLNPAHCQPS